MKDKNNKNNKQKAKQKKTNNKRAKQIYTEKIQ